MEKTQQPVAIIGMGGMFARSGHLKAYWRALLNGIDCISDPPATHCQLNDYFDSDPKRPDHIYCKRGGFLPATAFDPTEFGIPPSALEATDTSQLLGLVAAKMALADAGYGDDRQFDREGTSVILGVTGTQELVIALGSRLGHPLWRRALENKGLDDHQKEAIIDEIGAGYVSWQENSFPGLLGNVVAGRISNRLNLGGTNCVVDAACASSLSAVHLALLELTSGKSSMVVTGGVDTLNDIFMHMCFSKTGVLSHSGNARPFAADADGTVLGEGIGIVVLKRLEDAEGDGDRIYAVIKGIGSSSDGKSQSIYAPRAEGQARALNAAYESANIPPDSVGLIEAHGTGTRVGDEVEFSALTQVFGALSANGHRCALGSVKSMIGHTKAAAGAAGLMKAALALHHKVLPATLKVDRPDPKLRIEESPFYLNTATRPWFSPDGGPRRSGVSAFGFGGSNFHVVLEEYRAQKSDIAWDGSAEIVAFSGDSVDSLSEAIHDFRKQAAEMTDQSGLPSAAKTSRDRFSTDHAFRMTLVLEMPLSDDDLKQRLQSALDLVAADSATSLPAQGIYYATPSTTGGKLVFLFPGQGSQYPYMGRDLACIFPAAMEAMESAGRLADHPQPLTELMFPRPALSADQRGRQEEALRRTDVAQPALGAVSLAMLAILDYFGIQPDATCGHSYGELAALHAAGWIEREPFVKLSVQRGRLMAAAGRNQDAGTMLAVMAPVEALNELVDQHSDIVLANLNSPDQGVVSGPTPAIESFAAACRQAGHRTVRLPVAAAFHSPLIEKATEPFTRAVAGTTFTPTGTPVIANLTGAPYPSDSAGSQDLLSRQLTSPVQFLKSVEHLYADGARIFVEVGPKAVLSGLVRGILGDRPASVFAVDRSSGKAAGIVDLAHTIAGLAACGAAVDLNRWETAPPSERRPKMAIPLSGTNYRTIRKRTGTSLATTTNNALVPPTKRRPVPAGPPVEPSPTRREAGAMMRPEPPPPPPDNPVHPPVPMQAAASGDLNNALSVVRQGLESIQSLHRQTAQAHERFLETQAQAGRTLQEMMDSVRWAMASMPEAPGSQAAATDPKTRIQSPRSALSRQTASSSPAMPAPAARLAATTPAAAPIPPLPVTGEAASTETTQPSASSRAVADTLLAVVAELTGYPVEMLGMEMDIEADLGIDSIKRVEILSAMEEKMPHLPQVTPEMVGTLKTLGQIGDFLAQAAPNGSENPDAFAPVQPPSADDASVVRQTLLAVVAELTGYPVEMLGMEMDIEADLGIDSIKRVEILSAMEEKMPHLPQVTPEMVGTLKTLGQIGDFLAGSPPSSSDDTQHDPGPVAVVPDPEAEAPIPRQRIEIVAATKQPGRRLQIGPGRTVVVLDDGSALPGHVVERLSAEGIEGRLVPAQAIDQPSLFADAAGLILCPATPAETAFLAAKSAAEALAAAARQGDALFAVITRMDGAFGFSGNRFDRPEQGALPGLLKTAALEWPEIICRAIDLAPDFATDEQAALLAVAELMSIGDEDTLEIGLQPDNRVLLQSVAAPLASAAVHLDSADTVVVTGGARGVTAACAIALARATGAAVALIGRSPAPAAIPSWLKGIDGHVAMKKAILAHEFNGDSPTPKALEACYARHTANIAIHQTLDALEKAGVKAAYFSADVGDRKSLVTAIQAVRRQLGPVSALIHGAGVLHDRLITDKTLTQFRQVYKTKVDGLDHLLAATEDDALRYLILFSSVSARTGNIGQCDYAMANEVLNKRGQLEALRRKGCRVTAINWGPWDGGMVTPALKKAFNDRKLPLIPVETGARMMLAEMAAPPTEAVEVLVGSLLPGASPAPDLQDPPMVLLERRELDLNRYPVLGSHIIGGKPVVPFALITEWIGHGALKQHPGFSLHGLDDFRLLSGIRLEAEGKLVRLMAGKAKKTGDAWQVDMELRNGVKNGKDVIHSRAKAVLVDRFPVAPPFTGNGKNGSRPFPRRPEAIYGDILFHGDRLRAIKAIDAYSDHGMTAWLMGAPEPHTWMQDPIRERWLADPMVLDGAFQMAIVWCYEQTGKVCLPSYARSYRQFRAAFPPGGVKAVMAVTAIGKHKLVADFTFLDEAHQVVATLVGYEATIDESLIHAFRDNGSATVIHEERT